jgi:hypothetical protein
MSPLEASSVYISPSYNLNYKITLLHQEALSFSKSVPGLSVLRKPLKTMLPGLSEVLGRAKENTFL